MADEATVRIDLNSEAVRALLCSPEALAELTSRARRIAAVAGEGFEVETHVGRNRAHATVRSATWPARYEEAKNRRLTRAIDAGR